MTTIRIGTRSSKLALWQSNYVADLLRQHYPEADVQLVQFTTKGDKILDKSLPSIGGKGLFTEELEQAMLDGDIDCAVHSLKDLPTENPAGLTVSGVPPRAPVEDVLVSKHNLTLENLPAGSAIGTSSLRRAAQIRHMRDDVTIIDIRGNVPTRISKALDPEGPYDAIILARAGVERLNLMDNVTQILSPEMMLPAPGQGAIAIQSREDNAHLFAPLTDTATMLSVTAERTFLNRLQGGCSVPVAAFSTVTGNTLTFIGRVASVDGQQWIEVQRETHFDDETQGMHHAQELGANAANDAINQGAQVILAEVKA